MRFSNQGDKQLSYAKVEKSLKKLIQSDCINQSALSSAIFGGQITTECTRYWNDFSLDTSFEIILFQNGSTKDIELNDFAFSFIVKGYESWTNSSGYTHEFTVVGCNPKGDEFEFRVPLIRDSGKLVCVIYAMIILSETSTLEEAHLIWNLISCCSYVDDASKRLHLIIFGENFSKKVLEKYPFMLQVIKNGLNYHIDKVKEEISKLNLTNY